MAIKNSLTLFMGFKSYKYLIVLVCSAYNAIVFIIDMNNYRMIGISELLFY